MTTPTGTISMSDVNVELGYSSSALISLNDAGVRSLAGIGSGAISLNDLRGKSLASAYLFSAGLNTFFVEAYNWSSSGFGSKYSAPTGTAGGYSAASSSSYGILKRGGYVFAALLSDPRIWAREFSSSGWGSLSYRPQLALGGSSNGIAANASGSLIGTANGSTSPYCQVYPWVGIGNGFSGGGWGTQYSSPATPPTGTGESISWSRGGGALAIGHATSPRVSVYPFTSANGYGTKYSDPSTLPFTTARGVSFSNGAIVLASRSSSSTTTSAFPEAWAWSDASGFGTRYSNPSNGYKRTVPYSVAVSQDGAKVIAGTAYDGGTNYDLPNVHMWTWSDASGWGTYYTNPSGTFTSGSTNAAAINATSDAAAYGGNQSSAVRVWAISGSGYGAKFSDPSTLPSLARYGLSFA
jgi:hypothetical protein